jgi:hypothetical protein
MSFSLRAYTAEHRYRVRNVHAGAPVPPARRTGDLDSIGYRGGEDRDDAIIGRDGYVDYGGWGSDRIGWCVLCKSQRALNKRLRPLRRAGATVVQEGDTEPAGHAPLARIDEVVKALRPYRRREAPAGARAPALGAIQGAEVG